MTVKAGGVAQWWCACLACTRFWVPSPAPFKNKVIENVNELLIFKTLLVKLLVKRTLIDSEC